MKHFIRLRGLPFVMVACLILILPAAQVFCADESPVIQPKADKLLRAMTDYLAGLEKFSFEGDVTFEIVLDSGQKIQLDLAADVFLRRPDRFRAQRKGLSADQEFYYDGKDLVFYRKTANYYSSVEAPPTVEKALDYAIAAFDIAAPGADLLHKNAYEELTQDLLSGFYVDLALIDGVECHHLAFRGKEVDWQIWIKNDARPLPVKYLITSKWIAGAPQYTAILSKWNLDPDFSDDFFAFRPPAGAEKIAFFPKVSPEKF